MTNQLRAPQPHDADRFRPTPEYGFANADGAVLYPQTPNGLFGEGRVEADQATWINSLTEHAMDQAEPSVPEVEKPVERAENLPVEILVEGKAVTDMRNNYELAG